MLHDHAHPPERPAAESPAFSLVRWSTLQRMLAASLLLAPLWVAAFLVTR